MAAHFLGSTDMITVPVNCVCLRCNGKFHTSMITLCDECNMPICPVCGVHSGATLAPFGTWSLTAHQAIGVRASVWGRPN